MVLLKRSENLHIKKKLCYVEKDNFFLVWKWHICSRQSIKNLESRSDFTWLLSSTRPFIAGGLLLIILLLVNCENFFMAKKLLKSKAACFLSKIMQTNYLCQFRRLDLNLNFLIQFIKKWFKTNAENKIFKSSLTKKVSHN